MLQNYCYTNQSENAYEISTKRITVIPLMLVRLSLSTLDLLGANIFWGTLETTNFIFFFSLVKLRALLSEHKKLGYGKLGPLGQVLLAPEWLLKLGTTKFKGRLILEELRYVVSTYISQNEI